ncbi:MAG: DUF3307 domain-containing protein [Bacteroidales bacterium]|nr:DUF3307 domain-containing protein [Bacteroidales bacterium]
MILFVKLFLAHLLGDFVFQPEKWVNDKEKHKIRSPYLYYHILVHAVSLLIILQFNTKYLWGVVMIVISHFVIDTTKVYTLTKKNRKWLFFIDQLAHMAILVLFVYLYQPFVLRADIVFEPGTILLITSLVASTFVSSILIKILVSHWTKELDDNNESLANAGKYIGMLERLFVLAFVVFNQWSAIGFLLAAKSVFRFGDLSKAKDRKLTEYVLIGTLLSFAFAIGIGLTYNYLMKTITH